MFEGCRNCIATSSFGAQDIFLNIHLIVFRLILCISVVCLHVRMCTMHIPGAHADEKVAPDPLELELPIVVSHYVEARNYVWVLCKSHN